MLLLVVLTVAACPQGAADASHVGAKGPPLLTTVADVALPGSTTRWDYASLDATSGLLYLNHMGAGEVVVFDVRARQVVATLTGFPTCTGILAVPAEGKVFVSAAGEGNVVAFDTTTRQVVARLPAGRFPDGIAYEPQSRRVFVSDESGGQVTAVDAVSLKVVGHVALGGEAGNTQVDATKHLVYTNDQTDGDLVVIDPTTLRIAKRIPVGMTGNHGLYIDGERQLAFDASEDVSRLAVVDLATGKVTATYELGRGPDVLAFDPGPRRLFVASESGTVSVFDETQTGLTFDGSQLAGPNAHVVAVDPATHLAYLPLKNLAGAPVLRIVRAR